MDKNSSFLRFLMFITVAGILLSHAAYYYPFLSDDALISLRYAYRLIQGDGLTWTEGERVEGYTNLLWILVNASMSWLFGLDLILSARILGVLGAIGTVFFSSIKPEEGFQLDPLRLLTAGAILSLSAPLAVWSIGALEHGFMAGILASALLFCGRALDKPRLFSGNAMIASFLFSLLALLRADGFILIICAISGAFITQGITKKSIKCIGQMVLFPFFFLSLQFLFRIVYYHEALPNTVYAKVGFSLTRIEQGLDHVAQGMTAVGLLSVAVLISVFLFIKYDKTSPKPLHRIIVPLTVSSGWALYIAGVGGDIFPGWRQLLLSIVPLSLVIAEGISCIKDKLKKHTLAYTFSWIGILVAHFGIQMEDSENRRAKRELWEWGGYPVGIALKHAFSEKQPLLAVDAAGALAYWSELPCVDMLGLNDRFIARNPPPGFGTGQIGHELGNGDYVWKRKPDIIAFNNAVGAPKPIFLSGKQLIKKPDFPYFYQLTKIQGIGGNRTIGKIYIRYKEGRLGIQRQFGVLNIPGYLFSGISLFGAQLDNENHLYTPITSASPGRIRNVYLESGNWRIRIEPENRHAVFSFVCPRGTATELPNQSSSKSTSLPILRLHAPTYVDILVGLPISDTSDGFPLQKVILKHANEMQATHECSSEHEPLFVRIEAVERNKPAGTHWTHPSNIILKREGVTILLPRISHPSAVELSADNNDTYLVRYILEGKTVGKSIVGPKPNRGGLAVSTAMLPKVVQQTGIDSLRITPIRGDNAYSIGHVRLVKVP